MRTRELHGSGYYHVGSPVDTGYAEQMRAMYGREDVDPPREDPPTLASQSAGWQSRPGQIVPALIHGTPPAGLIQGTTPKYTQVWH